MTNHERDRALLRVLELRERIAGEIIARALQLRAEIIADPITPYHPKGVIGHEPPRPED